MTESPENRGFGFRTRVVLGTMLIFSGGATVLSALFWVANQRGMSANDVGAYVGVPFGIWYGFSDKLKPVPMRVWRWIRGGDLIDG